MALFIRDINENSVEVLTESAENGKKNHYIEGIFMQAEIKNRNGRIYPLQTLYNEMVRYDKDYIQTKRSVGELTHPDSLKINEDRISHLIVEMRQEGNNFIGKAKILKTPMGRIVKDLIDEGVTIGVSTRGMGSLKKRYDGVMEVCNDFRLICADIVSDPSGPQCFVNGILENTEYYYDIASGNWVASKIIEDTIKEVKDTYKSTTRKIDETLMIKSFEKFIEALGKK